MISTMMRKSSKIHDIMDEKGKDGEKKEVHKKTGLSVYQYQGKPGQFYSPVEKSSYCMKYVTGKNLP